MEHRAATLKSELSDEGAAQGANDPSCTIYSDLNLKKVHIWDGHFLNEVRSQMGLYSKEKNLQKH